MLARGDTLRPSIRPVWRGSGEHAGQRPARRPTGAWLVRDAASGCLLLQTTRPAGGRQSPIGEPLILDAGGARVSVGEGGRPGGQAGLAPGGRRLTG
ncbi:MAG: hypothetical protein LC647_07555 [Beggiatoa sp.]|nr:hypothetical protein [Beggiatoa sp.]